MHSEQHLVLLAPRRTISSPPSAGYGISVPRSWSPRARRPAWSGAAGSGWISCAFTGMTLPVGQYKVAVYNGAATPHPWSAKQLEVLGYRLQGRTESRTGHCTRRQLADASTANIFQGSGQEPGQRTFAVGPPNQYPNLYVDGLAQNYWVDAEVTPATGSPAGQPRSWSAAASSASSSSLAEAMRSNAGSRTDIRQRYYHGGLPAQADRLRTIRSTLGVDELRGLPPIPRAGRDSLGWLASWPCDDCRAFRACEQLLRTRPSHSATAIATTDQANRPIGSHHHPSMSTSLYRRVASRMPTGPFLPIAPPVMPSRQSRKARSRTLSPGSGYCRIGRGTS